MSEEESKVLAKRYREARQAIERTAYTGVFIVSEPVADELRSLVRELERTEQPGGDWFPDLERHSVAQTRPSRRSRPWRASTSVSATRAAETTRKTRGRSPGSCRAWRIHGKGSLQKIVLTRDPSESRASTYGDDSSTLKPSGATMRSIRWRTWPSPSKTKGLTYLTHPERE
jgi:hypothetical protein